MISVNMFFRSIFQRQEAKTSALDEQLKEYIVEWRKIRTKEEDDLKKLKEKQAKRKVTTIDVVVKNHTVSTNCYYDEI